MGVPTSEVGYTPVMPRREDHEAHKRHVVALGEGGGILVTSISTYRAKPDLAANDRSWIYRNTFLNLGAYNIQACTDAREYTLCFLVHVI